MRSADDSGAHDLTRTVSDLSVREPGMPVENKMELLIGAIRDLAKANLRLYADNKLLKRLMTIGVLIGVALFAATGYALYEQRGLRHMLEQNAMRQQKNAEAVASVAEQLRKASIEVAEMRTDLGTIPRVSVTPADPSDLTSEPVAVIEVPPPSPPPSGGRDTKHGDEPKPASLKIPLDGLKEKKPK